MEGELRAYLADTKAAAAGAGGGADAPIGAPLTIVVFGATGDLAREKLFPSLRNLMVKGLVPYSSTIWAYGRSPMAVPDLCKKQLVKVKFDSAEEEVKFTACINYFQGGYDDEEDFRRLNTTLAAKESAGTDRLYFLSVPPTVFGSVCACINDCARAASPGLTRVLVEKPFGRDSRSFAELNEITSSAFSEPELFRLDHYLAKQSIQTLVNQRMQRQCFFNSIWNKEHIKSLHISWKEDIDTEGRGGYFDEFGIIRDIVQNHLLQLFIFSCMDQPSDPSAEHITAAKVAFLQSVQTLAMQDVVLGQFEGYLSDETVPEGSKCPTYAAVSLAVDNETWKGVPMMITAGKGLSERTCTIQAEFKPDSGIDARSLVIRIQPNPGMWLIGQDGAPKELPFIAAPTAESSSVFDYERILFDGGRGSQLLMLGADELREAWRIFTPVLDDIDRLEPQPVVHPFNTVVPAGVAELAASIGMSYEPMVNSAVASGAKL